MGQCMSIGHQVNILACTLYKDLNIKLILLMVAIGTPDLVMALGRGPVGHISNLQPNLRSKLSSHTYKHLDCLYKMFYICLITTMDQNICTQYICMDILNYN